MSKVKKGAPELSEDEPSIISQIPKDKMAQAIQELVELAKQKKTDKSQPSKAEMYADHHPEPVTKTIIDPAPGSLLREMKKSIEDNATHYDEVQVCTGNLMDGLDIDIIDYSEGKELTDEQYDKLWEYMTDIDLVEMCENCELIETGEFDEAPGQSTVFYKLVTENEKAFKLELQQKILAAIK